jgi:transcriptional regulator with XRE-family HTH domain
LELRGLTRLIRLLQHRRDVRGQLGGHVLGRPQGLLRVAEELNDHLDARHDLLDALCWHALTQTREAAERLAEPELARPELGHLSEWLPLAVLLDLVNSDRPVLPEGRLRPSLGGLANLQERWCVAGACHVRLLSVRRSRTIVHRDWTLRGRRCAGKSMTASYAQRAMNALQLLIRRRMDENHWSYGDIARRGELPRSTVHNLATLEQLTRPPRPLTLERLAKGLDLPLDAVRVAAASAAGLHVWHEPVADPEIEIMVSGLAKLNPQERGHVQALIRSLLNGRSEPH